MAELIREEHGARVENIANAVAATDEPVVFRNLIADWPLVQLEGVHQASDYLAQFDSGQPVTAFFGDTSDGGRIFYTDELEKVNFAQRRVAFTELMGTLLGERENAQTVYMGSTAIDHYFPGLGEHNSLPIAELSPTVRLWIGNRSSVAAHYDAMDNIACVCAGRRRFTLFPPEQIDNLYVGPLDFTPAGQAVSLVDLDAPDFDSYPRYAEAERHALTAELGPGDAIFIPALWWHHVKGLDAFNVLINHWWLAAPAHAGPGLDALLHAILNIRDLPPAHRERWQSLFAHYVFEASENVAAHIPELRRGVLGEINDDIARRVRTRLRNNLNR